MAVTTDAATTGVMIFSSTLPADPVFPRSSRQSAPLPSPSVTVGCTYIAEDGHKGKADTHNDRQAGTNLPDGIQLDEGCNACNEHRILQQNCNLRMVQTEAAPIRVIGVRFATNMARMC